MAARITGTTKLAGIAGGPQQVPRSLSPAIHNAAFEALGLDWVYVPFPIAPEDAEAALRGLAAAGVAGFNVTMPHKLAAARCCDRLEGEAARTGAVNTVAVVSGALIGHNTDGEGLLNFLRTEAGLDPAGKSVLIIGAGGAARSVVSALAGGGAASIEVAARKPQAAEALATLAAPAVFKASPFDPAAKLDPHQADLIINATPLGQLGEEMLVSWDETSKETTVVDLVNSPPQTPLTIAAKRAGLAAYGGLGMLVHQAALSFEIWTGVPAPLEVMSKAAEEASR
jgi:shikimate dehydrogenase